MSPIKETHSIAQVEQKMSVKISNPHAASNSIFSDINQDNRNKNIFLPVLATANQLLTNKP